jgi:hypothetical protein
MGDGDQNGGALIVGKNGKQRYEFRQKDFTKNISKEEILKVLDIKINFLQIFLKLVYKTDYKYLPAILSSPF